MGILREQVDQILAVIVLYNVGFEESKTMISLAESLTHTSDTMDLVVYDNSLRPVRENGTIFMQDCLRIHYFHDPSNPGVSKAYNFAAQYAKQLKKKWILLLDQDTTFPPEAISSYISALTNYPSIKLFAPLLKLSDGRIVSPSRYCCKRGFALKNISPGLHSFKNRSPLNSGMLIDLDAFTLSEGYNEKVKLDFSDFQFIERFKKRFNQFCLMDVIALHDFSDAETNTLKLNERYAFYCDGAKNSECNSFFDRILYCFVVFLRATSLVYRTKDVVFYKTFIHRYLLQS